MLWGCVTFTRPLLPIDETRCVSVAWEMWQNGNLLVPHLNGIPYSHKPPLMFWLILVGWKLFSVNEWWPRLLPPLFGLGCLFLTTIFARRLWPDKDDIVFTAPHILLGCVLWTLFTTVVMYDMLVVFFVLFGLLCLHSLASGKRPFLLCIALGMSLGLGILSKGPVILIPFVMVAITAPWWNKTKSIKDHIIFYTGVVLSLLLAAMISLAWALPAAQSGGPEYAGAILWGQTASRVIGSFAHQRPWWWYIPMLPAILFPWTTNPLLWRNIRKLELDDSGIRFCLSWLMPCLVIFSMISGKQVYYLLPLFPAFALLVARLLAVSAVRRFDFMPLALSVFIVGLLMVVIPSMEWGIPLPRWVHQISPIYGIMVILVSFFVGGMPVKTTKTLIWGGTVCMVFMMGISHAAVFSEARPYYDVHPIALLLKKMEDKGYPLVHVNTYYGEFHFAGRLGKPIDEVDYIYQVPTWLKKHPRGRALAYVSQWPAPVAPGLTPEYVRPYRGKYMIIYKSATEDKLLRSVSGFL
jgi:hypothetical protein